MLRSLLLSTSISSILSLLIRTESSEPTFNFAASLPSAWLAIEADYASNITETVSQTFATTAVNTTTDQIDFGVDMLFGAAPSSVGSSRATQVFFSSTGTLPAPLVAGQPYYLALVSGTSYKVYPVPSGNDYLNMIGTTPEENYVEAQNYWSSSNAVNFTTQGSGTHTCYTRQLASKLVDKIDGVYDIQPLSNATRHAALELETDTLGKKYVRSRRLNRDLYGDGSYDEHGKTFYLGPTAQRANIKSESANKRVVWQTHVCSLRGFLIRTNAKASIDNVATKVNTTTNLITFTAHPLNTGDPVKIITHPSGVLPTGLAENTIYYIRDVSANTFSLHPTSADATANTNIIDITATGSGGMTVYAFARNGDGGRWSFFTELIEPGGGGGNTLSPRSVTGNRPNTIDQTSVATSGVIGKSGIPCVDWIINSDFDADGVVKVEVWFPDQDSAPTRADNGLKLQSGIYWVTIQPSSSIYVRFHDTYEKALSCVGIAVASLTNTDVIKYSAVNGPYVFLVTLRDGLIAYETGGGGSDSDSRPRFDIDQVHAWTFVVDFNDPAASFVKTYIYRDGVLIKETVTATAKGNTAAASGTDAGTWLNSGFPHVPFAGDMYASYFGSDTGAFDTTGHAALISYLDAKYTLGRYTNTPPIHTSNPRLTGSVTSGSVMTVVPGLFYGYPEPTASYVYLLDGVETGFTGGTYSIVVGDIGKLLSVKETLTNAAGTSVRYSKTYGPIT